jgi:hemin uptake protein HemP
MFQDSEFQDAEPMPDEGSKPTSFLPEPRTIRSEDLLRGDKEVVILHEDQLYRLRRTRNGKLILQK